MTPAPLSTKRFACIDVTLRDGHQCLWSTRMTTTMMTPILQTLDQVGYAYINILGGAVFDVCVRYLQENPWDRVSLLCRHLTTPCDALTRGQSLYTFALFPDDIVALNAQVLARQGVKVLTVYDALNDMRNLESSITAAHTAGMRVNAMLTYTLSPVHTDAYYVARARELVALQADFIAVKDPTGLLTPERAQTLFPALVQTVGSIPLQLHSHCQSGLAPAVYSVAMESGFRFGHTAVAPLANGASLPATEDITARARDLGYETGIQPESLRQVSGYFDWLCVRENKPRGQVATYDSALYAHQVPGGMISNLISQLQTLDLVPKLPAILEEVAQVRHDLGYPILVSPFAQYFVTQAVLNVVQGERYKTIPDEVRKYALGYYGQLAAPPAAVFLERAKLRPEEQVSARAGAQMEPWLPRLRATLGSTVSDEDLLLAAFYDQELLAPLRRPAPVYQFHTSPLYELLHYLDRQVDVSHARIRFGGTDITVSA